MNGTQLLLPTAYLVALLLVFLILPPSLIVWRLKNRARFLDFNRSTWSGFLAAVGVLALGPVVGWLVVGGVREDWFYRCVDEFELPIPPLSKSGASLGWLLISLFPALVWMGLGVLRPLWKRGRCALRFAMVVRVMPTVLGFAMLAAMVAAHGFRVSERHWCNSDKFLNHDPDRPGWNSYESQVAVQMRKELREILGYGK